MIGSLIEISLVGLITGFIFSVPVTGPIGILTISKTLQKQRTYAVLAATGAAIVDVLYCFIAVFGFVKLVKAYSHVIPYILLVGSAVIVAISIKIMKTKLDDDLLDENQMSQRQPKIYKRGALMTGFMINFLNPTLFFGWLTSSFIAMSFVASIGLDFANFNSIVERSYDSTNVDKVLNGNDSEINTTEPGMTAIDSDTKIVEDTKHNKDGKNVPSEFLLSLVFATFLGIGTIIWFYLFTGGISKFRKKMKIQVVNKIIQFLGIILFFFAFYIFLEACVWFKWFAWSDLYSWLI